MRVPHGEGLAIHTGPESCAYARKGIGEALTGDVRAGLLSRERYGSSFRVPTLYTSAEGNIGYIVNREMWPDPAWSKTPGTYRSSLCGNREIPRLASGDGTEVRAVNPKGARQR